MGRDAGTISRELRRNAATRGGKPEYRASVAQWKADMTAKRPKVAKLVANPRLRAYVESACRGRSQAPMARSSPVPSRRGSPGEASRIGRTGPGPGLGVRSRSHTG